MSRTVLAGALAAVLFAGLVAGVAWRVPGRDHLPTTAGGRSAQPSQTSQPPQPFSRPRTTWAQGSVLHYGDTAVDLAPEVVRSVVPSGFGMLLEVARRGDPDPHWVLFDGSSQVGLSGEPADVSVSPDGRYAGWTDLHGPIRPVGRPREVVVTDLAHGEVVLRSHDGVGGLTDDLPALYFDIETVGFAGFDERFAYWTNATGTASGGGGAFAPTTASAPSAVTVRSGRPGTASGARVLLDTGSTSVTFGGWTGRTR